MTKTGLAELCYALLRSEVKKQNDLAFGEPHARVASRTGAEVGPSTNCREMQ